MKYILKFIFLFSVFCLFSLNSFAQDITENNNIVFYEQGIENNINIYNDLKENLNKIIQEKKFDNYSQTILKNILDLLWENYSSYYNVYSVFGYASKKDYIEHTFLDILNDKVDIIKVYDESVPNDVTEWNEIITTNNLSTDTIGMYLPDTKKFIVYKKKAITDVNIEQLYLHETFHGSQDKTSVNNLSDGLFLIFAEGGANNAVKPALDLDNTMYNSRNNYKKISTDDNNYILLQGEDGNYYNVYLKYYTMIESLVGYTLTDNFKLDGNINPINSILVNTYGSELTNFVNDLASLASAQKNYDANNPNTTGLSVANASKIIDVESKYLDAFAKKITNINNKNDAIKLFNFYRIYKKMYMTRSFTKINDVFAENTNTIFNLDTLENNLYQKLITYKAINNVFNDANKDKALFTAILDYQKYTGSDGDIYAISNYSEPFNLIDINYVLDNEKNIVQLFKDSTLLLQYEFDEENNYIIKSQRAYSNTLKDLTGIKKKLLNMFFEPEPAVIPVNNNVDTTIPESSSINEENPNTGLKNILASLGILSSVYLYITTNRRRKFYKI